jgi:hypothetical protein
MYKNDKKLAQEVLRKVLTVGVFLAGIINKKLKPMHLKSNYSDSNKERL